MGGLKQDIGCESTQIDVVLTVANVDARFAWYDDVIKPLYQRSTSYGMVTS